MKCIWRVLGASALAILLALLLYASRKRESLFTSAQSWSMLSAKTLETLSAPGLLEFDEPSHASPTILLSDCSKSVSAAVSVGMLNRLSPRADCHGKLNWFEMYGFSAQNVNPKDLLIVAVQEKVFRGTVLFDAGSHISENLAISVSGLFDLLPVSEGDTALESLNATEKSWVSQLDPVFDFRAHRNETLKGGAFETYEAAMQYTVEELLPHANKKHFTFRPPHTKIIPFSVMQRFVVVYLDDLPKKCVEYHAAPIEWLAEKVAARNGLKPFLDLTSASHWDVSKEALSMFGFAPGLMESTGYCTRNRTMGVIASDIADSLSVLYALQKELPALQISGKAPLKQNEPKLLTYNKSKIYVAHIVSDGDNLNLLSDVLNGLRERTKQCSNTSKPCPPRSWSISPRIAHFSPAIRTYYEELAKNPHSADSFLMPPSGATYFYPGAARDKSYGLMQQRQSTVEIAQALDLDATVLWDLFLTQSTKSHWDYLKSFAGSQIQGVFFAPAPWILSPEEENPASKLLHRSEVVLKSSKDPSKSVVVFKELTRWDGITGKDSPNGKHYSIAQMGALLQKQSPGSLNFVYDISWSISVDTFHEYAEYLEINHPDIVLVDHRTLVDLARQKHLI